MLVKLVFFFFFKQKTAYEMRISDWSSDVCSSDLFGRTLTQRGYELRTRNANAAHALAHAMYEAGGSEDAERLIAGWLPGYDRAGTLHGHIAWHAALVALERGDAGRALEIYASHVQPSVSAGLPINIVSDTASFLWRLRVYGHAVPAGLWAAAAAYAAPVYPKASLPFADAHMAMLAAASGDPTGKAQRDATLALGREAGGASRCQDV